MIIAILTWLIMLIIFGAIGIAINSVFERKRLGIKGTWHSVIWYGIVFSTVYAQIFSLFYKVGQAAFLILLAFIAVLYILFWKQYAEICIRFWDLIREQKLKAFMGLVGILVIVAVGTVFAIRQVDHYDTYLYHAQNIRWIEEYGIVKGLGNFHNRFAYNSAFMCLQTLFSFSWIARYSLHTLNGFLWVFMMIYNLGTLKVYQVKQFLLSDLFKLVMVLYLLRREVLMYLSSPHTDMMALLLVGYIIIRWIELTEEGEKSNLPYGTLCILGVFAVSVKLSAILILFLVLKPAIGLLKEKRWKTIFAFILTGFVVILPFLIRNILISGYLVYPYASIDFFNVDWKMPASTVAFDNHEIVAWGRMLNDVRRYEEPISVWLPIWLEKSSRLECSLMLINLCLIPISILCIAIYLKKKKYDKALLLGQLSLLFIGWLMTAPLPRYGFIYMMLLIVYYVGAIGKWASAYLPKPTIIIGYLALPLIIIGIFRSTVKTINIQIEDCVLYPTDYREEEVKSVEWGEIRVFSPATGDLGNYYQFPELPYARRLEIIELRGDDISSGFRMKDQYKDREISTDGYLLDG